MIFDSSNRFIFGDFVETALAKESGILFSKITIPTKMMVRKGNLKNISRNFIWKLKNVETNTCFYILLMVKKYFYETSHLKSFYVLTIIGLDLF